MKHKIENLIREAIGKEAMVEVPANPANGDYSTNVVIKEKMNPEEVAGKFKNNPLFEKVEAVKGFVNFYLAKDYLQGQVGEILKQGEKYGSLDIGQGKKINVEFISANPTGPLTLGNGRGGFSGDVLANALQKAGYEVEREYYVNDRGVQIQALGHSVLGDDQAVYKGDYIDELKKSKALSAFSKRHSVPLIVEVEEVGKQAATIILETLIKPTAKRMGIEYNKWFFEKKELYDTAKVDKVLEELKEKDLAYEKDGALWFKSTQYGDDKDRVLVKVDGEKTYLASDVAYIQNKFERGFDKLIWFLGADHYGYVARMQAAVQALGYQKNQAEFIVMQLVRLFREGKEVRMSKREGVYVTLDELFSELCEKNPLGMDVARFFFLSRGANTHLDFDLDLAKEQSEKNPVFYIQYAHARMVSILRKAPNNFQFSIFNFQLLEHPSEMVLIKQMIKLPEVVEAITQGYQIQRLTKYATDLAVAFHRFYTDCHVLGGGDERGQSGDRAGTDTMGTQEGIEGARLALTRAVQIVLKNTLDLLGISSPEKM